MRVLLITLMTLLPLSSPAFAWGKTRCIFNERLGGTITGSYVRHCQQYMNLEKWTRDLDGEEAKVARPGTFKKWLEREIPKIEKALAKAIINEDESEVKRLGKKYVEYIAEWENKPKQKVPDFFSIDYRKHHEDVSNKLVDINKLDSGCYTQKRLQDDYGNYHAGKILNCAGWWAARLALQTPH